MGVLKEASGDRYLGEWVNDERHGTVRFLSSTGVVKDSIWGNDIDTTSLTDASTVMAKLAQGMVWYGMVWYGVVRLKLPTHSS